MFATIDTLQLWVKSTPEAIEYLRSREGTRVTRSEQSTGRSLADFVVVGNLLHESWFSPVQVNPQEPYLLPDGRWFNPFDPYHLDKNQIKNSSFVPWIAVQMSVPKVSLGHSVAEYTDHRRSVAVVLEGLQELTGQDHDAGEVLVRRADFCRVLKLPDQELAADLIDYMALKLTYPMRPKPKIHLGESVMWHVRQESFKAYLKLPELLKRKGKPPESELDRIAPIPKDLKIRGGLTLRPGAARRALRRAATGQVRFETTLRHQALRERLELFGGTPGHPYGVLLPNFFEAVDGGIGGRIMRADFDKVLSAAEISTSDQVGDRLAIVFGVTTGNKLYRFWELLCEHGDRGVRDQYPRATYYRYKAQLKVARVGVVGNDVEMEQKRREQIRRRQGELLNTLDGYGEHMRAMLGDEWVDELQREAGLPIPDRRTA